MFYDSGVYDLMFMGVANLVVAAVMGGRIAGIVARQRMAERVLQMRFAMQRRAEIR